MTVVEPTAIAARRDRQPSRPRESADDRVMWPCSVCGMKFDVTRRAARNYAAGRRDPRCMIHRAENPRPETKVAATRRELLNQYSVAEIFLMGRALELTLTGRRLPIPERLRDEVVQVEAEWLAIAASADVAAA